MRKRNLVFFDIKPLPNGKNPLSKLERGDFWLTILATTLVILGIAITITAPKFNAVADSFNPNGTSGTGGTTATGNGSNSLVNTPIQNNSIKREGEKRQKKADEERKKQEKGESKDTRSEYIKAYNAASKKEQAAIDKEVGAKASSWGKDGKKASDKQWDKFEIALRKHVKADGKSKASKKLNNAEGKAGKDADKNSKKDKDDDSSDNKSVNEVIKQIKEGKIPKEEPKTLMGQVGQAIFNLFWSSAAGSWLQKNSAGGVIFGGIGGKNNGNNNSELEKLVKSDPVQLIYPKGSGSDKMFIVSNWLEPALMSVSLVFLALALIFAATKMGVANFTDPAKSRLMFLRSMVDTGMSLVGLWVYPSFIMALLQFDGVILLGLSKFMAEINVLGKENILDVALKLGTDGTTINMLSSGTLFGSNYSGAIFGLIYLFTYLGLAVWIKYYYFIRSIAFTILISIGPLFIAFWSTNWGKSRAVNWLKELISTIYIQCIHALTLTFMALLMAWNNTRMLQVSAKVIIAQNKWNDQHKIASFFYNLGIPFVSGQVGKAFNRPNSGMETGAFETMVIGFIIMILFQPLSRSLAELFGIQSNMLDNIHQSTSRTLQTGAMIGGAALGIAATGAGNALAGKALLNGASNLKAGAKAFKAVEGSKKAKALAGLKAMSKQMDKHKNGKFNNFAQKMWGVMGGGAGQLMAAAGATGANVSPEALVAMTKAGGSIGRRAANLSSTSLDKIGLAARKKLGIPLKQDHAMKKRKNAMLDAMATQGVDAKNAKYDNASNPEELEKVAQNYKNSHPNMNQAEKQKYQQLQKNAQEAKQWQGLNDKEKFAQVRKQIAEAVYGNDNEAGGFVSLERVKNGSEALAADNVLNGKKYDLKNGYDAKKVDQSYIDGKVKAMGISDDKKNEIENSLGKDREKDTQYFADYNNMLNETTASFSDGSSIRDATLDAYGAGGAYVSDDKKNAMWNNDDLKDAPISKVQYARNVENKMKAAGFSQDKINAVKEQISGMENSKNLISSITNQYGPDTPVINQDVYSKYTNAQAKFANMLNGNENISAADIQQITDKNNWYEDSAKAIENRSKAIVEQYENARYYTNRARKEANIQAGADLVNPYVASHWMNGLGGSNNSSRSGSSMESGGLFSNPNRDNFKFNQRVATANRKTISSGGMSLSEANEMLPRVIDKKTGRAIVPSGSFRVATTNGFSIMQAKDSAGIFHEVGNYGLGDSALNAGQVVYTDLGMDENNNPYFANDPVTHQKASSYIFGEDGNSQRVPFSFEYGFTPNIESMIPTQKSAQSNNEFMPRNSFHGGVFKWSPSLISGNRLKPEIHTVEEYSSLGYNDFRLNFDNNKCVITGFNDQGKEHALSNSIDVASTIFKGISMPTGSRASLPLVFDGENLCPRPDINGISILDNNDSSTENATKEEISSRLKNENMYQTILDEINNKMINGTKPVGTNNISNNPGSISSIDSDTMNK